MEVTWPGPRMLDDLIHSPIEFSQERVARVSTAVGIPQVGGLGFRKGFRVNVQIRLGHLGWRGFSFELPPKG